MQLRHRFGKKSERFMDDPQNPQQSLWSDNGALFSAADATGKLIEDDIQITAHTRKKKRKSNKELPHRIETIPVSE